MDKDVTQIIYTNDPNQESKEVDVKEVLAKVYAALKEKGYNPTNQIVQYIMSGEPLFITSHNSARSLITKVEPPKLENVIIEDWDVVTGRIIAGMCTRDYTYFFKPSNDYHLFCNEKEKNLEIKGKIKNYTYINETSKSILLNVKPYLLIKNKTEEVECSITFDGLKREDEDAKMKCKVTSKENEGKFVMTTYYVNNKKYPKHNTI